MKNATLKLAGFLIPCTLVIPTASPSQELKQPNEIPAAVRAYDSLLYARIPLFSPHSVRLKETLPPVVDNSAHPWFSGFCDQQPYWTCLQVSSCTYLFGYEINRLRNLNGEPDENRYPFLYTWTRFNQGINTGVSSFHSLHAIRNQGHMNRVDMGPDSLTSFTGWANGYDKYHRAMKNRIRRIRAIRVDTEEGINMVRNYLYDHLDGSPAGGLAHFTSSAGAYKVLQPGTPEAGKHVVISLGKYPTHGFTMVGYNDSVRYDLNNDGQYTNHMDINGDGVVDVCDWEIGAFKQVESYPAYYSDGGFFYLLYSAVARDFRLGGPWNNSVYVIDASDSYTPLFTIQAKLDHNLRDRIKVMAGVSSDTGASVPEHLIEFPIFNFQGGELPLTGAEGQGGEILEFGLDATPLLSYVTSGRPARFFLAVEERDSNSIGFGSVQGVSFYHYGDVTQQFTAPETFVPIGDNGITFLSAVGSVTVDQPVIGTESLPPFQPGVPLTVQLQASGGAPPYTWSLSETYCKSPGTSVYQSITDQPLSLVSSNIPYAVVALPFSFPFFGVRYDTVFVNKFGMIQFASHTLPYPWISDELDMLRNIPAISPAFSYIHDLYAPHADGIWMRPSADSVSFRWKTTLQGDTATTHEFMATLFPDGRVDVSIGPVRKGPGNPIIYSGLAKGDGSFAEIIPCYDFSLESGKSYRYYPPALPAAISLTEEGLLTVTETDASRSMDIAIQVSDSRDIMAFRTLALSSGLTIAQELAAPSGRFQYQEAAGLDLVLKNTGGQPIPDLELRLISSQPGVLITDSIVQVGLIAPGNSVALPDRFRFVLSQPFPDRCACPFVILASSPLRTWEKAFFLEVAAPDIAVHNQTIEDGVNNLLDIGETAFLVFHLSNRGSLEALGLRMDLICNDPFVEILSVNPVTGIDLAPGEPVTLKYLIHALPASPQNHQADLTLRIMNDNLTVEIPVTLRIGVYPVALVTLSSASGSAQIMAHLLDSLNIGYSQFTSLPQDLPLYLHTFLMMGTDNGSTLPSAAELFAIRDYIEQGGNMYMENYRGWHSGSQAPFYKELFKYWYLSVPVYDYDTLKGTAGPGFDDMQFRYHGEQHSADFEVVPLPEATCLFENTDTYAKCLVFGYDGEVYKTIGSLTEFASLADSATPSTKGELLNRYLSFFGINRSGPYPFFHADHTHICRTGSVQFTDDSYPDIISWLWEFPGGSPSSSTEKDPLVTYDSPGVYDAILTVSDGNHSFSMHKKEFIRVSICQEAEIPERPPVIMVYPNPTRDVVRIRFTDPSSGPVHVTLYELNGKVLRSWHQNPVTMDSDLILPVSGISSGLYLLRVQDRNCLFMKKILIFP